MLVWAVLQTYLPEGHNPLITCFYEGRHILRQHNFPQEVSDKAIVWEGGEGVKGLKKWEWNVMV